jgi:ribosomal protein S1
VPVATTLSAANEDGRRLRHHWNVSQSDSDEWRALRERRKPTDEEWAAAKSRFTSGVIATGVVLSHHPFGFFVDLGDPVIGLVEITRVKESRQPVDPRDYPPVGQEISAVVLGAVDLQRQVHLSTRPSDLAVS